MILNVTYIEGLIEPINVVNVSLNVRLNDDHQMQKYQQYENENTCLIL